MVIGGRVEHATGAATASVTVRSDRSMSRGVEFIDGSLMVEQYEPRRFAPDPRHQTALIVSAAQSNGGSGDRG